MIPAETIAKINRVRSAFLDAVAALQELTSFSTLMDTSPELRSALAAIDSIANSRRLARECTGEMTCAIIGSSGHGKTTIMDELFPTLAARGWLETDVTDTTSQSLRIRHAGPGDPRLDEVVVHSWTGEQIKQLMNHPDVVEQNDHDQIQVTYLEDGVVVDGTNATLDPRDLAAWKYPRRVELTPLAAPYEVPADKLRDREFIRALTVKEQSAVLKSGAVLTHKGRAYDALQLRAIVKEVSLRDGFDRILSLAGRDDVTRLEFVDTPGLAVSSVVKDEVLRHFLGKKSNQIALELLRNDELDIIVHVVLCGQKSQFDVLWNAIEKDWGPGEMEGIAERLILAVNGMNIYFTNPDIQAKYTDPATTQREGDHFAATLEDNILQRMSPRGRVRPARVVFLDSSHIVSAFGDYADFYARHRKTMESWAEPGGVGHDTLARIGCVDAFRDNIDALADPDDRGQGFLIRQILDLVDEKGSAILLRKHLVRSGLLNGIDQLLELLGRYYDGEGRVNSTAVYEALAQCLAFLDPSDLHGIERFAATEIDPHIDGVLPAEDAYGVRADWAADCFGRTCDLVKEAIYAVAGKNVPAPIWTEFARHFDSQSAGWVERWGYTDVDFPPPPDSPVGTRDLLEHCLRLHGREMLFQLLQEDAGGEDDSELRGLSQSEEDQQQVKELLRSLEAAKQMGEDACIELGVRS